MLERPFCAAIIRGVWPSGSCSLTMPSDPLHRRATVRWMDPSPTARWRSLGGPRERCCCWGSDAGISSAAGVCSNSRYRLTSPRRFCYLVDRFSRSPRAPKLPVLLVQCSHTQSFGSLKKGLTPNGEVWDVSGSLNGKITPKTDFGSVSCDGC